MSGFYPQPPLLRQGQPCHNGDQQYDQDQTDNVEDYARADHLGYGDHSGAVDDGVLRRADRHHKAEGSPEDRGERWYQGSSPAAEAIGITMGTTMVALAVLE